MNLHPQYITDATGNRVSVVLSVTEYEELMEDLEDLAAIAERRDEPETPHDAVVEGLKRDGLL
jgi:PHD/YefM family antitoxin component YafN of YafNO toxin-antitoxin module